MSAGVCSGWQCEVSSRLEEEFRESLFHDMVPSRQALLRSQSGPGAGAVSSIAVHHVCGCGHPTDSSRSLQADKGAGKKVVQIRKCGSARTCDPEHAGPQHGFGSATSRRCWTFGGGATCCGEVKTLGSRVQHQRSIQRMGPTKASIEVALRREQSESR